MNRTNERQQAVILDEFQELTAIDSVSFGEREMADVLKRKLTELGFEVDEDDAGAQFGGNAGNVYGFLKGTLPGEPILFSAHMDTVVPGIGKKAVFHDDGTITSDGSTVLGSDDVAGIVEILGAVRALQESGAQRRDLEVLFPIGEEFYTKGSRVFDFSKIRAKDAYVLDLSGPVGSAALRAPSLISFSCEVKGKAAHAGFEPENGIHAITAASRAIAGLRQGHLDPDTTLNIGTITGGNATNIVPESCRVEGEIRSYRHERALEVLDEVRTGFELEAAAIGAEAVFSYEINLMAYRTDREAEVVRRFVEAAERIGRKPVLTETFGGSDCNTFSEHGMSGIVLSCGMNQVHSVREFTTVEDLCLGAELVAELLQSEKL